MSRPSTVTVTSGTRLGPCEIVARMRRVIDSDQEVS